MVVGEHISIIPICNNNMGKVIEWSCRDPISDREIGRIKCFKSGEYYYLPISQFSHRVEHLSKVVEFLEYLTEEYNNDKVLYSIMSTYPTIVR